MALEFYDGAGDPLGTLTFGGTTPLTPGVASTAQQLDIHNNRGGSGADTVTAIRLVALARQISGANTRYVETGEDVVDQRWIEVRIVQGINRVVPPSGWQRLGAGSWLALPVELANDEGVELEVRISPPAQADTASVAVRFRALSSLAVPIGAGFAVDGVLTRLGETTGRELIEISGDIVENPGGADEFVQLPDLVWESAGKRYALLTDLIELTATDGDAATLGVGEEYIATLSAGAGSVTITKSSKGVGLGVEDRPEPPADEVLLAYVVRGQDAIVQNADITQAWTVGRFYLTETGALTVSIGPGRGIVDGSLVDHDGTGGSVLTAPTSATSTVWLTSTGAFAIGAQPAGRPQAVWSVTADGSSITGTSDLRELIEPRATALELVVNTAALMVGSVSPPVIVGGNRPFVLSWPSPVGLALDSSGSGTGSTKFEIEYDSGSGYTSLFPDSGTDDRRPSIVAGASGLTDQSAFPTVTEIPAGARVRARAVAVPTVTMGSQATIMLRGCAP